MGRRNRANKSTGVVGAERKILQAEFFLGYLEQTSRDLVKAIASGGVVNQDPLKHFFSACLTSIRSVDDLLQKSYHSTFTDVKAAWKSNLTPEGQAQFRRMIDLRDEDVHFGFMEATALPKFIEDRNESPYSYQQRYNPALLGGEDAPLIEEINPDGQKVTGGLLRSTYGLFLDDGNDVWVEATTLCRDFIAQIRSLVEAAKAAGLK
jgi:hypothetical protein